MANKYGEILMEVAVREWVERCLLVEEQKEEIECSYFMCCHWPLILRSSPSMDEVLIGAQGIHTSIRIPRICNYALYIGIKLSWNEKVSV